MLSVLRFWEWVLGLFRAGFGAAVVDAPSIPAEPVVAPVDPVLPPVPVTSVAESLAPAKPKRKRKRMGSAVRAWNARLRSPHADA
ncbi:hypothetical protein [Myxococcus faecalis]|uniref:hypothetical protein n=1 Tax=Myxococcus faecalis TaxID=3115646 RepID=UPI003CF5CA3F